MVQTPVQISFRHLDYSPFIASAVRRKIKKLEKYYSRMTSVRVMIEPSERRHHQGNLYHIRIKIAVPRGEVVVQRDPPLHQAHENIYVALRDAFDAARRQLEDYVRLHSHEKKRHHEAPMHGQIVRLFPNEECGFLRSEEGKEVYFHKNSVLNQGFDKIYVGEEVRFVEEEGEKGPQASTVDRIGKEGKRIKLNVG